MGRGSVSGSLAGRLARGPVGRGPRGAGQVPAGVGASCGWAAVAAGARGGGAVPARLQPARHTLVWLCGCSAHHPTPFEALHWCGCTGSSELRGLGDGKGGRGHTLVPGVLSIALSRNAMARNDPGETQDKTGQNPLRSSNQTQKQPNRLEWGADVGRDRKQPALCFGWAAALGLG